MTIRRKPTEARPEPDRKTANRKIDEASAESMDASDPPSFNPGTAGAGEDRRSAGAKPKAKR
ncbi:hypothetical protein ACFW16_11730 [Inquilinus sp. NPDC058860]|uniref:hypothetical protein n=1 Tax=Inquilinus sp. NPDC058860 TaxID=3346652 RepID=UPI0036A6A101